VAEVSLKPSTEADSFALRFRGYLRVEKAGTYAFQLGSDDGSRLFLNGRTVIDLDGQHPYLVACPLRRPSSA
jgi:hypothetical protein